MKGILKEYWVEIVALLVGIIGVGMVVFDIGAVKVAINGLAGFAKQIVSGISSLLMNFSLNDLFGLLVALAALAFIYWRVRYRVKKMKRWTAYNCPKCGGELHRVHRSTWDRIVSVILLPHARRYRCENSDCGWNSLLLGGPHYEHHHHKSEEEKQPIPQI